MSDRKKENLFAKLAQQTAQQQAQPPAPVEEREPVAAAAPEPPAKKAAESPPPSPAPPKAAKKKAGYGKRFHPDYCQANGYVPKKLKREVDRALLEIDGLDYSTLVEDLLRKWLKSKGISA